jgi:hypothetical protein
MQSLKDTFYLMLRDRVAAGNPARTVVVRGVTRPGVIVVENELPGATAAGVAVVDAFCLRWTGLIVDTKGALGMTAMQCEIKYATDGSSGTVGMDRGRALTAMDEELSAAVGTSPRFVPKVVTNSGQVAAVTGDGTNVFWGDAVFGPAVMQNERMERTATVEVFCYGE